MDQHHLVTLRRADGVNDALRLVFSTPLSERGAPSLRDVLWWLVGDARAVDRAGGVLDQWASTHGYPLDDPASVALFVRHVTQASSLKALLGDYRYRALLAAYDAEVAGL
jgi:hypothetical protein